MEININDVIDRYKRRIGDLEHNNIVLELQIERLYAILKENDIDVVSNEE